MRCSYGKYLRTSFFANRRRTHCVTEGAKGEVLLVFQNLIFNTSNSCQTSSIFNTIPSIFLLSRKLFFCTQYSHILLSEYERWNTCNILYMPIKMWRWGKYIPFDSTNTSPSVNKVKILHQRSEIMYISIYSVFGDKQISIGKFCMKMFHNKSLYRFLLTLSCRTDKKCLPLRRKEWILV